MLQIGGITSFTTLDYPEHLAAVVFCQGCPWRCRYCHNPDLLQIHKNSSPHQWNDFLEFLEKRKGLLDGVVFSGGEPTLQKDLSRCIQQVSAMGYKVGLHTGGMYPRRLKKILPNLSWIGFDVKTLPEHYPSITSVRQSGKKVFESLQFMIDEGLDFECRTTVHWDLISMPILVSLAKKLSGLGVKNYYVQLSRTAGCYDGFLKESHTSQKTKNKLSDLLSPLFENFEIRE
jgi:pyruvate formate lyase activating enzyme